MLVAVPRLDRFLFGVTFAACLSLSRVIVAACLSHSLSLSLSLSQSLHDVEATVAHGLTKLAAKSTVKPASCVSVTARGGPPLGPSTRAVHCGHSCLFVASASGPASIYDQHVCLGRELLER